MTCMHCKNGWMGSDVECKNGVLIDDEFTEGFPKDVAYPHSAPCHPNYCLDCNGSGAPFTETGDHDDCETCNGTGYIGGNNDSQERLAAACHDPSEDRTPATCTENDEK